MGGGWTDACPYADEYLTQALLDTGILEFQSAIAFFCGLQPLFQVSLLCCLQLFQSPSRCLTHILFSWPNVILDARKSKSSRDSRFLSDPHAQGAQHLTLTSNIPLEVSIHLLT